MNLKIKNAINYFNDNRKEGESKMNQTTLGSILLPDMNSKTAGWYVSRWSDGEELGKLTPCLILKISFETGFDLDSLFGLK